MNLWLEEKEKTSKEIVLSDEAMKNNLGSTESGKMRGVVDRNGWQTQHDRRRQCTQGARQQAAEGPKDGCQDGRQGQPGEKVLVQDTSSKRWNTEATVVSCVGESSRRYQLLFP